MASVLDSVKHYQHTIEKYPTDEHKVLKCIDKLYNLAVTVQHLQETGVGRTVNALRKEAGDVGQAARALVYKWKLMVAAEESDQETDQNNDSSTHNGHGSGKDSDDNAQSRTKSEKSFNPYERSHSSSKPKDHREINGNYSGSKKRYHSSEDEEPHTKRSKHSSSSEDDYKRKSHGRVKKEETESESDGTLSDESDSEESDSSQEEVKVKQEIKKEHSSHKPSSSKQSSHNEHSDHKSSSSNRSLNYNRRSSPIKERHSSDTSSTKEKSHSSDKHKSSKEKESNSEKKYKTEHKSDAEKSHKDSKSSSRHTLEKQSSSDKHSSSEKHGSSDKHRSSSSHKSDSGSDKNKTSSDKHSKSDKHKSSSQLHASEKEKHKSSSEKESERSKHKVKDSTSNSSSSKEKHSSSSKDKSRDSSSSKEKLNSRSSEKKHSSSSDNKSNSSSSKGHSEKNDEKSDKKSKHRSSSSSHKSSKSSSGKNEEVPKKKVQIQISEDHDTDDGIDCGSGASFAEALGMISPAKSKKKLLKDIASPNNDYSAAALLAPTAKLAPLPTLEISSLPEISPNYKPRPPPRAMPHFNDEESMSCVISSKNQRTKVYSGNKVIGGKIPSLYEMCVNVLQEHIDALEYTGGVPYEILKPVVDRATPQQLFILEHYNPYLMEETDHLWQKFCQKNFRNKQRQENEAWREMYVRCQEEQEIRLKSLTNNIRIAQEAKKAPIKQTKMAYVDSVAKPPRNIAKKQAQHGTARLATGSPAARVAALAAAPNVLRGGAAARAMAPLPSSGASSFKPKKAPLMAKALQIMRGRKR